MPETTTPEKTADGGLSSTALLGLGLYVVEIRTRRKDKTLTDWTLVAAFVNHREAYKHEQKWRQIGSARVLIPNAEVRHGTKDADLD